MTRLVCSLTTILVLATPAAAQPSAAPATAPPPSAGVTAPATGDHTHDGFYLRLTSGVGFTRMTDADQVATISGAGGNFGLALGGALTPNLIVYGEVFDDIAISPEVEIGGSSAMTVDGVNAGVVGIGLGAAYYVMPANVYVSGTLAASKLTVQKDGEQIAESDLGFGVSAQVGKEWWVSPSWGLGIAGQVFVGSMADKNNGPRLSATAAALALSATFN